MYILVLAFKLGHQLTFFFFWVLINYQVLYRTDTKTDIALSRRMWTLHIGSGYENKSFIIAILNIMV